MATRTGKAAASKSKEVTWSEKDLAKHMLKDKRRTTSRDGSPKSSPKVSQRKQAGSSSSSGKTVSSSALSLTAPVDKSSRTAVKGKERLSSTAAATASRDHSSSRSSRSSGGASKGKERKDGTHEKRLPRDGETKRRDTTKTKDKETTSLSGKTPSGGRSKENDVRKNVGGVRESIGSKTRHEREKRDNFEKERESGDRRKGRGGLDATSTSSLREKGPEISKNVVDKNRRGVIPQPMKEVRDGEEDDVVEEEEFDDYDDDNFEEDNYNEDDFEEDIEEEESESETDDVIVRSPPTTNSDPSLQPTRINLVEIMEAIDEENKGMVGVVREKENAHITNNIQLPQQNLETSPLGIAVSSSQGSMGSQRSMSRRKFVDFSSSKKIEEQERVGRITKRRGQDLLSMIELDVVSVDLFDLQPLSEYEVYMRSYGSMGTQQVACQTGEDNVESETQTEEVIGREKWTQWPPEDAKGYGCPIDDDDDDEVAVGNSGSTVRLASFLKRASQVMAVLLEENTVPSGQSSFHSNQSQIPFCTSRLQINLPEQLQGCMLTSLEYCPTHPHLVMTTHTPINKMCPDSIPRGGGAVCVWNTREPSQPQYLLVCESPSVCGCFNHLKAPLVFSGNDDGTLVVWDLRENVAMHTTPPGTTKTGLIPRLPTFSTAALSQKNNHHSPILTLHPITTSSPLHTSHTLTETETLGLSFQLATLDKNGLLIIWVAVETKPHPHGSESDLGLIPNGRVKLVWGSAVDTVARSLSPGSIPVQTLCIRFHPTDSNHMFIGTDEGTILHQTRYGRHPIPRQYQSQTQFHCPCDITSLSFSPWQPDFFLASYSNGMIALYHIKKAKPLTTWSESTNGIAVLQAEWAWHHPGIFYALDYTSTLYQWNMLENDNKPINVYKKREGMPDVISFRLSPSSSATPTLALCLGDGSLEIHQLTDRVSRPSDREEHISDDVITNFTNYLQML